MTCSCRHCVSLECIDRRLESCCRCCTHACQCGHCITLLHPSLTPGGGDDDDDDLGGDAYDGGWGDGAGVLGGEDGEGLEMVEVGGGVG